MDGKVGCDDRRGDDCCRDLRELVLRICCCCNCRRSWSRSASGLFVVGRVNDLDLCGTSSGEVVVDGIGCKCAENWEWSKMVLSLKNCCDWPY